MSEPRPHRVTPVARPSGADLDVTGFVTDVLTDLVSVLRDRAALLEDLCAVVDGPAAKPDPFRPEAELPTERLVEALSEVLPTGIRLHHGPLAALHGRLGEILARQQGPRPRLSRLPEQQDRRAS